MPDDDQQPATLPQQPQIYQPEGSTTHPQPSLHPAVQPPPKPTPAPADPEPPTKPQRTATSGLAFIFSWIVFPLAAVFILHFFVFQAYHVVGTSMVSTLQPNNYLIVSKVDDTLTAIRHNLLGQNVDYIPARDQIIVFHYPEDPSLTFVKRVIGLPGDHLVIANGKVTIYNSQHPNGFDPNTGYEPAGTVTQGSINEYIPAGNLFVLGDNRTPGGSFDSRDWGFLPTHDIIGNVVLRLLPLDQSRTF